MSMTNSIHLTAAIVNQMLGEAQQGQDKEICGLVAVHSGQAKRLYPIQNCAEQPQRHYLMEPQQQIQAFKTMREQNETLFGIYHSHPKGPAHPSRTDIRDAYYAENCVYFIISMNIKGVLELGAFRIEGDKFKELKLTIGENK